MIRDSMILPSRWKSSTLLLIVGVCFLVQVAVDRGLRTNVLGKPELTALLDPLAHVSLAIMVLLPWASALNAPPKYFIAGVASAILIDLDHFIAAGSLSLSDAISLPARPMAHSLLFCGAAAVLIGLAMRSRLAFGAVGVALISHISRDASGGGTTPLFWPSDYTVNLPGAVHLTVWAVFALVGCSLNGTQSGGDRAGQ